MNYPSVSREKLKYLLALGRKKDRLETGQVIVEGANIISQLVSESHLPVELYVEAPHPLLEAMPDIPVFKLQKGDLQRICDTHHAQGIAALYPHPKPREALIRRGLYLDGISDPGNMGTIFRIASAFALDGILLSEDCVEISSPKVIRASLGAVYTVAYRTLPAALIPKDAYHIVALEASGSTGLMSYKSPKEPTLYVIGSEAHGLSSEMQDLVDDRIRIEMAPGMESLNAAIASGILAHYLYLEASGILRLTKSRPYSDLTPSEEI